MVYGDPTTPGSPLLAARCSIVDAPSIPAADPRDDTLLCQTVAGAGARLQWQVWREYA